MLIRLLLAGHAQHARIVVSLWTEAACFSFCHWQFGTAAGATAGASVNTSANPSTVPQTSPATATTQPKEYTETNIQVKWPLAILHQLCLFMVTYALNVHNNSQLHNKVNVACCCLLET